MPNKDYYSILGVNKSATSDEIKTAYRDKARVLHPDMNREKDKAEAEENFKQMSEAYQVLIDKDKRKMYDLLGKGSEDISQVFWGSEGFSWEQFTHFEDLQDIIGVVVENIINKYFGTQTGSIFNELLRATGVIRDTMVKNKTKYEKGKKTKKCKVCNGEGVIYKPLFNMIMIQQKCEACNGSGRINK